MPNYYFHISSRDYCSFDDVGVILDDLGEAHWYALKLIYKMRVHLSREDDGDWMIKITDDGGATPLVVLSSSVPWRPTPPKRRRLPAQSGQDQAGRRQRTGHARHGLTSEDGPA